MAGCATAKSLFDFVLMEERTPNVAAHIFASVSRGGAREARKGFYTINDAADVSEERLHRSSNEPTEVSASNVSCGNDLVRESQRAEGPPCGRLAPI